MGPVSSVDDVIIQPTPAKEPSKDAQAQALLAISETLARAPDKARQKLVSTAMRLTRAQSAGLSMEDHEAGKLVLRWTATAGEFSRYLHQTMPRDFSPCGTAMDRRHTLIMREPVRFYPYIAELHVGIRTAMLVPFITNGKCAGTLWVVDHSAGRNFSTQDTRMVEALATFASAIQDAQATNRSG
jgi:GAF domain-containing protein